MKKRKIYFASPLFTEMEREWNEKIVSEFESKSDTKVYLPQRNMSINDKSAYANSQDIMRGDMDELLSSDAIVAVLDGQVIDAGVAAEIGVAHQRGMKIIGFYSDSRTQGYDNAKKIEALGELGENQFAYINLFVVGLIKDRGVLVSTSDELIKEMLEV